MSKRELEEAIEKLKPLLTIKPDHDPFSDELKDAFRLSIEALERCQHNYLHPTQADFRRLPSETEENSTE